MGGCCFAPTRRQFLWWYWLLLVSIVGIPMLLAVWYVARGDHADEETRQARGKTAASVFWGGTFVVAIGLWFVVVMVSRVLNPPQPTQELWIGDTQYWLEGFGALAVQFFLAFFWANGTNDLVRKRPWYGRFVLFVLSVFFYLVAVSWLGLVFRRPAINVMQFMACMLPAHYWGKFKDAASPQTAWRALWAFVIGATLFFAVSYFGEPFAELIVGVPGGIGK